MEFFIAGLPVSKGSARAFMRRDGKGAVVVQDNDEKQKPWASVIAYSAQQLACSVWTGPIKIDVRFTFPRPKSHFGTGKNAGILKESAPIAHISKPDLDKLVRCAMDAMTGVVWRDDSQIAEISCSKIYGKTPGMFITIDEVYP